MAAVYRERASPVPGAVTWTAPGAAADSLVLPDGCMDLMWQGDALLVAGPDTRAQRHPGGGPDYTGLRFPPGMLPLLLAVPAAELRDRQVRLDEVLPTARVRRWEERVGAGRPGGVLDAVGLSLTAGRDPRDPAIREVVRALGSGTRVADVAARLGLSPRQLHRRCLAAFGYGPKVLARILRLQSALARVRAGDPYATVAIERGYSDQAHLARDVRALTGTTLTALAA